MLHIAGQTAGPIGLNFFVGTHGLQVKKSKIYFFFKIFFPRAMPGPSAGYNNNNLQGPFLQ